METNEGIYWLFVFFAWILSVITFFDTLSFDEGKAGTVALVFGALAIWILHKTERKK